MTRKDITNWLLDIYHGRASIAEAPRRAYRIWFLEKGMYTTNDNSSKLTPLQMEERRKKLGIEQSDITRVEGSFTIIEAEKIREPL